MIMKMVLKAALGAGLIALAAACGGSGDDALGDNVADAAEANAAAIEEVADNTSNEVASDMLEDTAENVRDAGEAQEEAIDDADVVVNQ